MATHANRIGADRLAAAEAIVPADVVGQPKPLVREKLRFRTYKSCTFGSTLIKIVLRNILMPKYCDFLLSSNKMTPIQWQDKVHKGQ